MCTDQVRGITNVLARREEGWGEGDEMGRRVEGSERGEVCSLWTGGACRGLYRSAADYKVVLGREGGSKGDIAVVAARSVGTARESVWC